MRVSQQLREHLFRFGILIGILALMTGIGFLVEHRGNLFTTLADSANPMQKYADQIIKTCSSESYPPSCYDKEIPKLMDKGITMEQAFEVTRLIQNKVNNYYYCHVLGHELAAKETAKDPSKWTEVIGRCPTGMCSNGCLHGAAQERFRSDVLTSDQVDGILPQLAQICQPGHERSFTGLEQASCYHALGHLSMYLTGADVPHSIAICNQIAKPSGQDYTQTCYEGVYMQIFQPLEPEDFALVKDIPAKTIPDAEKLCDTFTGEQRAACHRESWPLYRQQLETPTGLTHFCSLVNNPTDVQRCYNAMFYVLTAQFNFDESKIVPLCLGLPDPKRQAQCFGNSASRFLETDYRLGPRAVGLCKIADQHGYGDRCYSELLFYSSFNYHEGSPEFQQICNDMPEPWRGKCLAGEGKNTQPSQHDF